VSGNETYSSRLLKGTNLNKERGVGSLIEVGASANAREVGHNAFNMEERAPSGVFIGRVMWGPGAEGYAESTNIPGLIKVLIPKFSGISSSPDPGPEDAANWITCYPVMAFAGSSADSEGSGSSYGFHYTPRKGDMVTVMFANADAAFGLWLGCVSPGLLKRFGNPDSPASRVDGEDLRLPAGESPEELKPTRDLTVQTKEAGLGADTQRGATPEQDKIDNTVIGLRSYGDRESGRAGHSFVMYDDPEHSMLRLRSGAGAQLILNDVGNFVYLNTQSGKAWLELKDDGHVDVYGSKSISFHAVEDVNIAAGRDLNLEVGRDVNFRTGGRVLGMIGEGYGLTVAGDAKASIGGAYHLTVDGALRQLSSTLDVTSGNTVFQASGKFHIGATGNIKYNSAIRVDTQAGADSASQPSEPEAVSTAIVPGEPTREEYTAGKRGQDVEIVSGRDGNVRMPTHEPWDPSRSPGNSNSAEKQSEPTSFSTRPSVELPTSGPLTYRNNNPGAIRADSTRWVGATGSNGGFVTFNSPADGFRAQTVLLNNYYEKHGLTTTREMIERWAPPNENPTESYIADITAATGVGADEDISDRWYDPEFRFKFQKAMTIRETGGDAFTQYFSESDLSAGLSDGGIGRESSAREVGSPFKFIKSRLTARGA